MALLKNYYNSRFNVTIENCYWKIELENGIWGGKNKIHARLCCYKDKQTADTNDDKYVDFDFEFTPNLTSGINFIAQAYLYVKTLPEFQGAVDV